MILLPQIKGRLLYRYRYTNTDAQYRLLFTYILSLILFTALGISNPVNIFSIWKNIYSWENILVK